MMMLKSLSFLPSWTVDDSDLEGYGFPSGHSPRFLLQSASYRRMDYPEQQCRLNYPIRRFELCNTFFGMPYASFYSP